MSRLKEEELTSEGSATFSFVGVFTASVFISLKHFQAGVQGSKQQAITVKMLHKLVSIQLRAEVCTWCHGAEVRNSNV